MAPDTLTVDDFGDYATEIEKAVEAMFGCPWSQVGPEARLTARSRTPPKTPPEEETALELARRALALRDQILTVLPSLPQHRWGYLRRLATELLPRARCIVDREKPSQPRMVCEIPMDATADPWSFEKHREQQIVELAFRFPRFWSYLPTSARGPHCPRPAHSARDPNILIRGISASLVLGGWFTKAEYSGPETGAELFRLITKRVFGIFDRLGRSGELKFGIEPPKAPIVGTGTDETGRSVPIYTNWGPGPFCRLPSRSKQDLGPIRVTYE